MMHTVVNGFWHHIPVLDLLPVFSAYVNQRIKILFGIVKDIL